MATPFTPSFGFSQTLSLTSGSSTSVTFTGAAANNNLVLITNLGPGTAWVRWASAATTALASGDLPVPSGSSIPVNKSSVTNTFAGITNALTASLVLTPGEGDYR